MRELMVSHYQNEHVMRNTEGDIWPLKPLTCSLDHFHLVSLHSKLCNGAKIVDTLRRNLL